MISHSLRAVGVGLLLASVPFLAGGCSSSVETATVTGIVTFRGTPLKSGEISFVHDSGAARSAVIGSDGRYQIDNAPVGDVSVGVVATVQEFVKAPPAPPSPNGDNPPDAPATMVERSLVPKKYNDPQSSGLKYTLKGGRQIIDLTLKE